MTVALLRFTGVRDPVRWSKFLPSRRIVGEESVTSDTVNVV